MKAQESTGETPVTFGAGVFVSPQRIQHMARHTADRHTVQFYEDEDFLASAVAGFVSEGLSSMQPAILIATPEHQNAFSARLRELGHDVDELSRSRKLVQLDGRTVLPSFMQGGAPDPVRFAQVVGAELEKLTSASGQPVRVYGELVDLLWQDGNSSGALALEELWTALAGSHRFSLLCSYSMGNFRRSADAAGLREVCSRHTHVVPTEAYMQGDRDQRLVEVALLQQRAAALEHEIEHRETLERQLRETVLSLQDREDERELLLERERSAREEAERARVLAEQANRAKSEFLAVMSHELRTPLNAIGGYAELMEIGVNGPISEQQRDGLARIQRSQRHLLGLINQVLNYARIETGNARYEIADIPVGEALRAAEGLFVPQLRAKGLRYVYDGCDVQLEVRADGEKLQQIILSLLANAVKFTDRKGEIRLEVEAHDGVVNLRVRDSGIGIAADKLGSIFDPFVQVDANYTRTRDGVGLGLAISRDLARGMGGDLIAESAEGVGSAFTLTLPRVA